MFHVVRIRVLCVVCGVRLLWTLEKPSVWPKKRDRQLEQPSFNGSKAGKPVEKQEDTGHRTREQPTPMQQAQAD